MSLSLSNGPAVTGSEYGIQKNIKFRNLQKLSLRSVKQININVEWKIVAKLNVHSTAFFEPEASKL